MATGTAERNKAGTDAAADSLSPPSKQPAILSIQSSVAFGHVGNSAASLPLQRLGFDVWPVNTVQLGHHPGYGRFSGHVVEPERLAVIIEGLLDRAPLENCLGLLSGYLGEAASAGLVASVRHHIRQVQPNLTYLLDPVIGDEGPGVFVSDRVPLMIKEMLLPIADIVTPNQFELAHLTGQPVTDLDDAEAAAARLRSFGPGLVVATGLRLADHPHQLGLLASSQQHAWLVPTPHLPQPFSGTGDTFAALFLGHYLRAPDIETALERATTAMFALVEMTAARGEAELSLIAAQDAMLAESIRFAAIKLR